MSSLTLSELGCEGRGKGTCHRYSQEMSQVQAKSPCPKFLVGTVSAMLLMTNKNVYPFITFIANRRELHIRKQGEFPTENLDSVFVAACHFLIALKAPFIVMSMKMTWYFFPMQLYLQSLKLRRVPLQK